LEAKTVPNSWIISGDSHVLEPGDLWSKPLGGRYGDAVPRMVTEFKGVQANYFFTGLEYCRIDELVEGDEALQEKLIAAGTDPASRLKCLDEDGVQGEIINSTWMLYTMRAKDDALVQDCCRVFNDWLAEYCDHAPKRLYGTAMVHLADIDWACNELERTAKRGLKSVIINCNARPDWAPYQDKRYDPFWARAEELDQPVTLHIITGNEVDPFTLHGGERINVPTKHIGVCAEAGPVIANEFIFGGILDRFPRLKLVCSEFEVSWLPYWLFRVRQIQDHFGPVLKIPAVDKPIDAYMQQIYHGLIDDPYLDKVLDVIDPKTIMWGSDFPHTRCTYPNTRQVIDRMFSGLDEAIRDDIVFGNCARFYNFEIPAENKATA
jgi:predicted TIM-barrel fold metal-dependent hydrolase